MVRLTHERLTEVLHYDSESGVFAWKLKKGKGDTGNVAGSAMPAGYLRIMVDGERFFAHRLAWFYVHKMWPTQQIDHINLDNSDNKINNLREATQSQNQANKPINARVNSTGYKGVSYKKSRGKFIARIRVNKKLIDLGYFDTAESAHLAYVDAANTNFGEFARAS